MFSAAAMPVHLPAGGAQGSIFSASSPALGIFFFFAVVIPTGVVMSGCSFDFHFLHDVEYHLIVLVFHLYVIFEEIFI